MLPMAFFAKSSRSSMPTPRAPKVLAAIITVLPSPDPISKRTSPAFKSASLSMYSTTVVGLGTKGAINISVFPSFYKINCHAVMPHKRLFWVAVFLLRRISRSFACIGQGFFLHLPLRLLLLLCCTFRWVHCSLLLCIGLRCIGKLPVRLLAPTLPC